jgi:hypothetical protein
MERRRAHSKVIDRLATAHVAKEPNGVDGDKGMVSFGSYVRREFALGFSAYSGSYAMTGKPVRQLNAAPEDSLDGRMIANRESYVSLSEMQAVRIAPRLAGTRRGILRRHANRFLFEVRNPCARTRAFACSKEIELRRTFPALGDHRADWLLGS